MTTTRDRYRGCLLGGAVGDALGAGVEFMSLDEIRGRCGPAGVTGYVPCYGRSGAITDDTQMTLFTAEGLLRARQHGEDLPGALWQAYQRWLATQGRRGSAGADGWLIGSTTAAIATAPEPSAATCWGPASAPGPSTRTCSTASRAGS
jgi:ADP-ribosylglycohydrolase